MLSALAKEALLKMREELSVSFHNFPAGCCTVVSGAVESKLGMGMKFASGFFVDDQGIAYPHAWNTDPEGELIIDLTTEQFGGSHSSERLVIVPIQSKYADKHYIEGGVVAY